MKSALKRVLPRYKDWMPGFAMDSFKMAMDEDNLASRYPDTGKVDELIVECLDSGATVESTEAIAERSETDKASDVEEKTEQVQCERIADLRAVYHKQAQDMRGKTIHTSAARKVARVPGMGATVVDVPVMNNFDCCELQWHATQQSSVVKSNGQSTFPFDPGGQAREQRMSTCGGDINMRLQRAKRATSEETENKASVRCVDQAIGQGTSTNDVVHTLRGCQVSEAAYDRVIEEVGC
jgi:hypothetical protein